MKCPTAARGGAEFQAGLGWGGFTAASLFVSRAEGSRMALDTALAIVTKESA